MSSNHSFTLIELLIVIGILGILAAATVVVLNPAELLAQARDTQRTESLSALNRAVALYQVDGGTSFGSVNTVYISLPNTLANCTGTPSYTLPALPSGYSYNCVASANLGKVDGTGWLPINLTTISTGSPLGVLPIDPVNSDTKVLYYAYVVSASKTYVLSSLLESSKFLKAAALEDGGTDPGRYETGSNLSLWTQATGLVGYWGLDEGSGTSATDSSGNNNIGTLTNSPTWSASSNCKVGGQCLSFDGITKYVSANDSASLNNGSLTAAFWFTLTSNPNCDANNNWRALIRKGGGCCTTAGWDVVLEENQRVQFDVGLSGVSSRSGIVNVGMSVDTPLFLTFTYDSVTGDQKVWSNGSQSALKTNTPASIGSTTSAFFVAGGTNAVACPNSSGYTPGFYDDIRIYNRELSTSEITAIYNATK